MARRKSAAPPSRNAHCLELIDALEAGAGATLAATTGDDGASTAATAAECAQVSQLLELELELGGLELEAGAATCSG